MQPITVFGEEIYKIQRYFLKSNQHSYTIQSKTVFHKDGKKIKCVPEGLKGHSL